MVQTLEIKLDITDELIAQAGVDSLKNYLMQSAESFKLELLAQKLRNVVGNEEQIDADFQDAKKLAWAEYKEKYLPEHLKGIVNQHEKK